MGGPSDAGAPAPGAPAGPCHGLPRSRRIRKRPDFIRIQDSPVRVMTRHLLLLLARGGARPGAPSDVPPGLSSSSSSSSSRAASAVGLPAPRLGVVASRKVGPAVARNRAKRLVREAFRLHPEVFPAGIDVVIIVRPGTHLLTLAALEAEVVGAGPVLARRARDLHARGTR